jgi:hypothetical protein
MKQEKHMSSVSLEFGHTKDNRVMYGRKTEEYIADFCLVSRRILDEFEYEIFRRHFLEGADYHACCSRMKIDRYAFFHAVYQIEQKLGRTFREMRPYGLFPLDEYFGGTVRLGSLAKGEFIGNPTDSLPAEAARHDPARAGFPAYP